MGIRKNIMFKTTYHSNLYWRVNKVHYENDEYVKLNMTTYYKQDGSLCEWIPRKNYKIIKSVYLTWEDYEC